MVCACFCVHTVGVWGWLFVLNGHLYSSFMSRAVILRDRVICVCVCVCLSKSKINMVHCGCRQRSQGLCECVCVFDSQIAEQSRDSGSQLYKKYI